MRVAVITRQPDIITMYNWRQQNHLNRQTDTYLKAFPITLTYESNLAPISNLH